jgi:hypothetical protein
MGRRGWRQLNCVASNPSVASRHLPGKRRGEKSNRQHLCQHHFIQILPRPLAVDHDEM